MRKLPRGLQGHKGFEIKKKSWLQCFFKFHPISKRGRKRTYSAANESNHVTTNESNHAVANASNHDSENESNSSSENKSNSAESPELDNMADEAFNETDSK